MAPEVAGSNPVIHPNYLTLVAVLLIVAATSGSCRHPRPVVDGVWVSNSLAVDRQSVIYLVVALDGDDVSGYACRVSNQFGALWRGIPLRGEYPWIGFSHELPPDAREVFTGRFGTSGGVTLEGELHRIQTNEWTDRLHFSRSERVTAPPDCR